MQQSAIGGGRFGARHGFRAIFMGAAVAMSVGCSERSASPPAISLVESFATAEVSDSPSLELDFPRLEWRFDGASPISPEDDADGAVGWSAFNDVEGLGVRDGELRGRAGELPILTVAIPEKVLPKDRLWAIEIKLRISAGTKLGVDTFRDEEIDRDEFLRDLASTGQSEYMIDLRPGDVTATYTLSEAQATFSTMRAIGGLKHIALRFVDADGADFALESVRVIPRTEHLAAVPAGVGWHGLDGVFRETLVARAPEELTWRQELGDRPLRCRSTINFASKAATSGLRRARKFKAFSTLGHSAPSVSAPSSLPQPPPKLLRNNSTHCRAPG